MRKKHIEHFVIHPVRASGRRVVRIHDRRNLEGVVERHVLHKGLRNRIERQKETRDHPHLEPELHFDGFAARGRVVPPYAVGAFAALRVELCVQSV